MLAAVALGFLFLRLLRLALAGTAVKDTCSVALPTDAEGAVAAMGLMALDRSFRGDTAGVALGTELARAEVRKLRSGLDVFVIAAASVLLVLVSVLGIREASSEETRLSSSSVLLTLW
jgi:hypothetical protein